MRYELALHTTERVQLDYDSRSTMSFAVTNTRAQQRSSELPTTSYVTRYEVTSVEPTGDAVVAFDLEDVRVEGEVSDPRMRKRVDAEIESLQHWHGSWRISPSGRISDVQLAPTTQTVLAEAAEPAQGAPVFPDSAIGIGARWQVISQNTFLGVTWNWTASYHLVALADDVATLDVDDELRAGSQTLSVGPNELAKLTEGSGHVTRQLTVPLRAPVALGNVHATTEASFYAERGSLRPTRGVMGMHTETTSSVKRLDSP